MSRQIVDLKKESHYIPYYVALRNTFQTLLMTTPVTIEETKDWILTTKTLVRIVTENKKCMGAVLLHLERKGEVSIFTKDSQQGYGTLLLQTIESLAKDKNLKKVWAWTRKDNIPAGKFFIKNGYKKMHEAVKSLENQQILGTVWEKTL